MNLHKALYWGLSDARLAQSVERKALNLVVVGSSPTGGAVSRSVCRGGVAQMVERSLSMREVQGSIPCISTFFPVGVSVWLNGRAPDYGSGG